MGLADVDQDDFYSFVVLVRLVQGLGLRGRFAERGSRIARHKDAYYAFTAVAGELDFIGRDDRDRLALIVLTLDKNGQFKVCGLLADLCGGGGLAGRTSCTRASTRSTRRDRKGGGGKQRCNHHSHNHSSRSHNHGDLPFPPRTIHYPGLPLFSQRTVRREYFKSLK